MLNSGGFGGVRRGGAGRPQLKVCYLCGQQFGSASIGIHIPQCYTKKVAQWEIGNPATRGAKPKHPDMVDWKGSKNQNAKQLNDEQFHEFEANLTPCPKCGRTFLPDRLPVHLRGCKGNGGAGQSVSRPVTQSGKSNGGASTGSTGSAAATKSGGRPSTRSTSTSPSRRLGGGPLLLPTCYLCGQQFGTASIAIHVPQCYTKKLLQWEAGNPATRGKAPRHPDEVNWRPGQGKLSGCEGGGGAMTAEEQSTAQFQEFVNNLEPCPNCGRKFLSDRLIVHLRSCRPGHTAKRVNAAAADSKDAAPEAPSADTALSSSDKNEKASCPSELDRVNPIRNRVPKGSSVKPDSGRVCPHCDAVEHDTSAKYCRECGWNLDSRALAEPCSRCKEPIFEGARFCSTCGEPINGAAASEREAGGENVNAPTVRLTSCPACQAVCDVDGNFCDNCGAALGSAEPAEVTATAGSADGAVSQRYLYCEECHESIDDLDAVYCEDCGGKLQLMERSADNGDTTSRIVGQPVGTLRPEQVSPPPARTLLPKRAAPKAAAPIPSPRSPAADNKASAVREPADTDYGGDTDAVEDERAECPSCGRRFAPEVLERHSRSCGQQTKRRPVFNMTKQRLADCDDVPVKSAASSSRGRASGRTVGVKKAAADAITPPSGKDWRAESRAFREAMRSARQVSQVIKSGGNIKDLPPPTYTENPNYVPCPHCHRTFAPVAAERHIPRCATTMNRPKPPPKRR